MRISGIDRDVSEVEILLTSMSKEQALKEVAGYLANTHTDIGQNFGLNVELDDGKKIHIEVSEDR